MHYAEMDGLQKEHAQNYLYIIISYGFYIKTTMKKWGRESEGNLTFFNLNLALFCMLSSENEGYDMAI